MNITVENTLFKKSVSHPDTCESGSLKTQVDCGFVRSNQWKLLKVRKVLHVEESIIQHKPLVCDFKTREVKYTRK